MSIRCTRCGNENQDRARFCMHCSQPLTQPCPTCGTVATIGARFCQQCGGTLGQGGRRVGVPLVSQLTGRLPPSALLASRYRIVRKLGAGGMAAVYLAEDQRLTGKQWAIKEMTDAALTNTTARLEAIQAFRQEAEILAQLDHPNLPKVVDYFSEGGNQYLVMEYIQGQTLGERFAQNRGPLPESQVLVWADKLCQVLAYLHNQRPPIIFRDLKPDNIMLRADGEIKLIDFGIARHFKPGQSKDTQAFGTIGYAPPEQHGKGQSDVRSDIYALGATLHCLLTGRDPSLDPFTFARVRTLNSSISSTLDDAIAKAVSFKPEDRWHSMEALRQALRTQPIPASVMPQRAPAGQFPGIQAGHPLPPTVIAMPAPDQPYMVLLPHLRYASYGKRVGAYLIDSVLQGLLAGLIYAPIIPFMTSLMQSSGALQSDIDTAIGCTLLLVTTLIQFFYTFRPTARFGKTLGKRMVGIRVVNRAGNPPKMGRTLIRYLFGFGIEAALCYVLIGLLGFLWPLWDERKQAWHDKIAGTFVVEG